MRRAGDNIRKYWNEALARLRMYRTTQVEGALGCPKTTLDFAAFWDRGRANTRTEMFFLALEFDLKG